MLGQFKKYIRKEAAVEIGLPFNISKTKAMIMSHSEVNTDKGLNIGGLN